MFKTKSIKAPSEPSDGRRISVMSRHTLPDGITPDPKITEASYDEWWSELAPHPGLVGAYYRGEIVWSEFEERYLLALGRVALKEKLQELINLAKAEDVTVLCVEATPEYCHRRLLAEECQQLDPGLEVEIR